MMEFEVVIGLEVHAQLSTRSKVFCGCSTRFGELPNRNTCPVCLGLPGSLPVLNREVVTYALRLATALGCQVRRRSVFARKNYFYPDLPKGYQISQYDLPLAEPGRLEFPLADGTPRTVRINRVHLEEDAGKNIHLEGVSESLVDFNRCGMPLVEIVSEPDLRSTAEAAAYLREVRDVVRFLGVSDGHMEEGSFRCDANVSVMPVGSQQFGVRTELKNLNSFKFVQKALDFEVERHISLLRGGQRVVQETRLYDDRLGVTLPMRSKEDAHDYRYFPEPDLPPLLVDEAWLEQVRASQPRLPSDYRTLMLEEYGLPWYDVEVLSSLKDVADYAVAVLSLAGNRKLASNWLMTEMLAVLKVKRWRVDQFPVSPAQLAALVARMDDGSLSVPMAKEAFVGMWQDGRPLDDMVAQLGSQVSDEAQLEAICRTIVENNPDEVSRYLAGKSTLMKWFVGQGMRESRGKGNPRVLTRLFERLLEEKKVS